MSKTLFIIQVELDDAEVLEVRQYMQGDGQMNEGVHSLLEQAAGAVLAAKQSNNQGDARFWIAYRDVNAPSLRLEPDVKGEHYDIFQKLDGKYVAHRCAEAPFRSMPELVFEILNEDQRPGGYSVRSFSMGDVILRVVGGMIAEGWLCQPLGYRKLSTQEAWGLLSGLLL